MDLYPSLTLKPGNTVTVLIGPDFLWRNTKADGLYLGPSGSFAPYASSRAIGTDLNLDASRQFSKRMQFRLFKTCASRRSYTAPGWSMTASDCADQEFGKHCAFPGRPAAEAALRKFYSCVFDRLLVRG